jgi:hypothetical protein
MSRLDAAGNVPASGLKGKQNLNALFATVVEAMAC